MAILRIWWIPQVPMKRFMVDVPEPIGMGRASRRMVLLCQIEQAKLLLSTLDAYDQFQFDNNIKPDYRNAGGLEVFEDGEWCEWHNADGQDINEIMRSEG